MKPKKPRPTAQDPSGSVGPTSGSTPRYPRRAPRHATLQAKVKNKVRSVPGGFAATVTRNQKPTR